MKIAIIDRSLFLCFLTKNVENTNFKYLQFLSDKHITILASFPSLFSNNHAEIFQNTGNPFKFT